MGSALPTYTARLQWGSTSREPRAAPKQRSTVSHSRRSRKGTYARGTYGEGKSARTSFATRAGKHFLLGTKSQGALATFQDGLAAPDQANAGKAAQAPPSRAKLRQPCPPKAGRAPPRWEAGPDQAAPGQERSSPGGPAQGQPKTRSPRAGPGPAAPHGRGSPGEQTTQARQGRPLRSLPGKRRRPTPPGNPTKGHPRPSWPWVCATVLSDGPRRPRHLLPRRLGRARSSQRRESGPGPAISSQASPTLPAKGGPGAAEMGGGTRPSRPRPRKGQPERTLFPKQNRSTLL